MDREQYARLQQLFAELCDATGDQRRERLAKVRAESAELADRLELLLARDARPVDTAIEGLQEQLGPLADSALPAAAPIPAQIAHFRVTGVLGAGGMGTVYRAEQQRPRRDVALKVLRAVHGNHGPHGGEFSDAALRRFEREAQVLGRLQHPGIAQIFEAG